ncbi:IS1096 element passenger TnpR family protein [Microbacterium pumilum]|uniref:Plasmid pRiA4b Orf3-like domain-containing protein n=1 Tax=Microbacterium pumilum TaxID=344165 RepID=A0ABN2T0S2_9MICO
MRSSTLRHLIRLRLTLVGPLPEIWREVVVDRDLSLAHLRDVIQAVFEGQDCRHHLFTDDLDSPVWSRTRRRWGDRLTMIDLRDPTVIDEASARIGSVLRESRPLYYGHTCEDGWLVEVEAHEDILEAASTPPVRVTAGERRSPLPCCRGPFEHSVLVGVLEDPAHPEREALRAQVERTIGPWSHFDPEEFDIVEVQRRLDMLDPDAPRLGVGVQPIRTGPLEWLVARLPRPARAGLERQLATSGLDLPAVITNDEARAATREFGWVVSRAADGGIPLIDGIVDPEVVRIGSAALGCDEEQMLRLIALAKRGHLLYARGGRLRANKRSAAAVMQPSELWSLLARELGRTVAPGMSGDLFLLAIADGSLADPEIGIRRCAEAVALLRQGQRRESWGYHGSRSDDCEQTCDCPNDGAENWHDVIARVIRDAATDGAGEEAVPLAAQFAGHEARDLGFDPDWFERSAARPYALAIRSGGEPQVAESEMLAELDDLIRLLSMFGLERGDAGTWIVPPTLQEFARESLRRPGAHRVPAHIDF